MRRLVIAGLSLLLCLVLAAFGGYAWLHWNDKQIVELLWFYGQHVEISPGQLMVNCLAVGAGVGVAATLLTFGARWLTWRDTIEGLRRDKRRLAAANRALEAALPVLREKYDDAIGALDPSLNALNEPIGSADVDEEPLPRLGLTVEATPEPEAALSPEGDAASVAEIAHQEAALRRGRR